MPPAVDRRRVLFDKPHEALLAFARAVAVVGASSQHDRGVDLQPACDLRRRASSRQRSAAAQGAELNDSNSGVSTMDGFTGFKTAAVEELPDVVTVIDPFHVTRLAGEAVDECRRRVQQDHPWSSWPQG